MASEFYSGWSAVVDQIVSHILRATRWEEAFLKAGGYEALNFILWEIASSTKRQVIHEM